eukprot:5229704-Prymnesium_polylepis.2
MKGLRVCAARAASVPTRAATHPISRRYSPCPIDPNRPSRATHRTLRLAAAPPGRDTPFGRPPLCAAQLPGLRLRGAEHAAAARVLPGRRRRVAGAPLRGAAAAGHLVVPRERRAASRHQTGESARQFRPLAAAVRLRVRDAAARLHRARATHRLRRHALVSRARAAARLDVLWHRGRRMGGARPHAPPRAPTRPTRARTPSHWGR